MYVGRMNLESRTMNSTKSKMGNLGTVDILYVKSLVVQLHVE